MFLHLFLCNRPPLFSKNTSIMFRHYNTSAAVFFFSQYDIYHPAAINTQHFTKSVLMYG